MAQKQSTSGSQQARRKGEIAELQDALNNNKIEQKRDAIRKIIDAMTRGKDVSMLFPDIVKNMETQNMEFKKLIYLYIINYAKSQPDLAILAINSFRKDAVDKVNPFLRSLAVRTMGCIRVKQITEYLLDPLKKAIKDEDSYVRKTAAICIAKLYDVTPELIEEQGFLKLLETLVNDGNAMVVSNAIQAQIMIQETRGDTLLVLTPYIVQKLFTALNECNEWGCIYILEALVSYIPPESKDTEGMLERVAPRLNHTNPGVVLAATKVIMKYMDYLTNAEVIRTYCKKLTAPLISLLSAEHEIIYVALKNINLIIQKRPMVLDGQLKVFFCNFNDPIYIKLQKLEILIRLANVDNIHQILHELKEYTSEIDVEFVRKSIRAIGRCAIKLDKTAEKCIYVLWECLKTKVIYVVYETIIVIRDIFRKYPRKYEAILKDLCDNLKLDDPDAKASMIWIIGEYVETIQNADQLLANFAESFKEEQPVVQHQILNSCVKLFLMRPQDGFQIVQNLLKQATQECENPDLRDRGYIYFRLLGKDPELTKKIVFSERPTISDSSYTFESDILEKLLDNLGTLSSVYYKPPEQFVKKLRDTQNLKELEINEENEIGGEFLTASVPQQNDEFYKDVEGVKEVELPQQNNESVMQMQQSTITQDENLLDMGDDEVTSSQYQGQQQNQFQSQQMQSQYQQQAQQQQIQQVIIPQPDPNTKNIKLPDTVVLPETQMSSGQEKVSGLKISASFQKESEKIYLYLTAENKSPNLSYSDLSIKFNQSSFKLTPTEICIGNLKLNELGPGQSQQTKIEVNCTGQYDNKPPATPFKVQCALKTNYDVFVFDIPCCLSCLFLNDSQITTQQYAENSGKFAKKQESIPNVTLDVDQVKQKLLNNDFFFVGSRTNNQGIQIVSYSAKTVNGMYLMMDAILDKGNQTLNVQLIAQHPSLLPLFLQAVGFILRF